MNKQEKIIDYVEKGKVWADYKTDDDVRELVALANELDIDAVPSALNFDEEDFNRVNRIISIMCDTILEEDGTSKAVNKVTEAVSDKISETFTEEMIDTVIGIFDEAAVSEEDIETINETTNNESVEEKGEEIMMNNTINNDETMNEETMANKAREFADNAKDKLEDAVNWSVNNIGSVRRYVKRLAGMKGDTLENYITVHAQDIYYNFKETIIGYKESLTRAQKDGLGDFTEELNKTEGLITQLRDIIDEDELNGWGKFKAIVKALVMWIVRLVIRVAQIVLKIAVTVVVGTIRIAIVGVDTLFNVCTVANKEIIQPTKKEVINAYRTHKAYKAERAAEEEQEEEDFEEFDEMVRNS